MDVVKTKRITLNIVNAPINAGMAINKYDFLCISYDENANNSKTIDFLTLMCIVIWNQHKIALLMRGHMTTFKFFYIGGLFRLSRFRKSGIPGCFYCYRLSTQVFLSQKTIIYKILKVSSLDNEISTGPTGGAWTTMHHVIFLMLMSIQIDILVKYFRPVSQILKMRQNCVGTRNNKR